MAIYAQIHRGVVDHFPARVSEWVLAGVMVTWGWKVLQPGAMFAATPSFHEMARMAPEEVWGFAAIAIGLVRLAALVINGTFAHTWYGRLSPHVRGVMSFLSMFIFVSISIGLWLSGTENTGMAVYPWLAVLDFWNVRRAFQDAGGLDEGRRNGPA